MKSILPICLGVLLAAVVASTSVATPAAGRQEELINLIKHDCGSCHGLTLKGGLGTPLLPERLSGRPDEDLVQIILEGLADTPMPPWAGQLAEDEAMWIVRLLKKGLPQ